MPRITIDILMTILIIIMIIMKILCLYNMICKKIELAKD